MERRGPPISLDEFRRRFGDRIYPENRLTPIQQIAAVQRDAQQLLLQEQKRFAGIDEDAYVTRDEAWKLITFLGTFNRKIARVTPGSMVDLRKKVVDHGLIRKKQPRHKARALSMKLLQIGLKLNTRLISIPSGSFCHALRKQG